MSLVVMATAKRPAVPRIPRSAREASSHVMTDYAPWIEPIAEQTEFEFRTTSPVDFGQAGGTRPA